MRATAWRVSIAIAFVAAACSTFDSSDGESTTPLDGGAPDSTADAAPDTSVPDGVAPAGDAGCSSDAHLLCDDFSSNALPSAAWTRKDEALPAALALSQEDSVSAPQSLLITYEGGPSGSAYLVKNLPVTLRRLTCTFSIRPVGLTNNGADGSFFYLVRLTGNFNSGLSHVLLGLTLQAGGSHVHFYSYPADGGATLDEGVSGQALALNRWSLLSVTLDLDAKLVEVLVDSKKLMSKTFTVNVPADGHNGGTMSLGIGGVNDPTRAFIDDVVCDRD